MTQQNKNYTFFDFINMVVTFFGVGRMKLCPGTWGSIATLPFWIFINFLLLISGITYSFAGTIFIWFLIIIGLFFLGMWASNIYMKEHKVYDAGEIVIDEVVGQLLTYVITTVSFVVASSYKSVALLERFNSFWQVMLFLTLMLVVPILFFRLFDIAKPWFIGRVDKNRKDGFGVMIDDVLAGLVAGALSSVCIIEFL